LAPSLAALPAAGSLPADTRRGWIANNLLGLKGVVLTLAGPSKAPLTGFYCEVHGPIGVFDAFSEEARKTIDAIHRPTDIVKEPAAASSAFLEFPEDFQTPSGERLASVHHLPTGTYHQLWWAWERQGLSFSLVPVALSSFEFFEDAGPRWRKTLAERRARTRVEREQRERWSGVTKQDM
jgi:hypothetical protein